MTINHNQPRTRGVSNFSLIDFEMGLKDVGNVNVENTGRYLLIRLAL